MLPLSELVDVFVMLDRNSLDVLEIVSKYLRQVVVYRLGNVCFRPAARWLSGRLRHAVVNSFKLQVPILSEHIPLFRCLEPNNFILRCVTCESCTFTLLTTVQLQTLVSDLLPSRDYNFSACSFRGRQLSDGLLERWVVHDVRRIRFDSKLEVQESDLAITDDGILNWICGSEETSKAAGASACTSRLLVLYKARLSRTFIDKLAQVFLNSTAPRSATAHIEGHCKQNIEAYASQLKPARGIIGEVQFVNENTNEILCVLLCGKRRIEIERRQRN